MLTRLFFAIFLAFATFIVFISFQSIDDVKAADNAQYNPDSWAVLPTVHDKKLKIEVVAEGLEFPTNMVFLGQDDILVTEKNKGTVQRIVDGKIQDTLLDVSVATRAERGLLGIAVSPNHNIIRNEFTPTYVYLYFTESASKNDSDGIRSEKSAGNSLYRYELEGSKLSKPQLILDLPPAKGVAHNGGAIIIGPDDSLYIPIGDGDGHTTMAQNVIDGGPPDGTGGILTFNPDELSSTNLTNHIGDKIKYYAYGIRNSFGLDFDPITGYLWDTENGNNDNDEINLVEPGFNSGWLKIQGKSTPDFDSSDLVTFDGFGKYSDPEFSWLHTVGPTKIKFLNSDKLGKQYENDILVADVKYGKIYHFELNENRDDLILSGKLEDKVADSDEETEEITFASGFGGITDLKIGPDGYLYVLSFGHGKIYRIQPETVNNVQN